MNITTKQKAFADYFLELGSDYKAAIKAGYAESTANNAKRDIRDKPCVSEYINKRLAEIESKRAMTADEVMLFYSSVVRGEVKDQFGLEVSVADRIKAADSLMKRYAIGKNSAENQLSKLDRLLAEVTNAAQR